MESAILAVETRVQELEETLNDPGFYASQASQAPRVLAELDATRTEVTRLYARWAELEAIPK